MSISNKTINKPSSPLKNIDKFRTQSPNHPSVQQNRKVESGDHKLLMKKNQETVELEMKTLRTGREKKALNEPQQQKVSTVAESSGHKSTAIDEATRHEAREYMKKQREKRKLEVKKEVDKSFVIQQRLDELRKTTRNVISKKPKPKKNPIKVSPPLEYYSMNNRHMKEIKILKLKPMSAKKSPKVVEETKAKQLEISAEKTFEESSPEKPPSPVKKSSFFEKNLVKKVLEPKLLNQGKKILQLQNRVVHKKPEVFQHSRHSSKENQKPSEENLKLRVPDVKLSMSAINRTEIGQRNFLPTDQIPFWLQDTSIQPYPYNFIWAVRKKLEAYNSAEEAKQKSKVTTNFETPHARKPMRGKKSRRFPDFLSKHPGDDSKYDLQRPTIVEDSETNVTSLDNDIEANTISEISSIKSDMALVKSQSQEKQLKDEDDTTISESIFHSVKEDGFIGKKRESINSEFDRNSFDKKKSELKVSPNTSEKRENFLLIPKLSKQNDLDNNRINQEKEGEYQKMLQAFNQSLSHVIEVNQMLTTVLTSKSSSNGTAKNYTSSFENNIESEVQKSTDISEMIENLVLQSKPAVPSTVIESRSDSSSIATFIEDSQSKTLKPEIGKTIRDPPIMYNETAPELSSSTTKMTMSIVQQKIEGKAEGTDNTLNESNLLNILNQSEAENSFNVSFAENNASFGIVSRNFNEI